MQKLNTNYSVRVFIVVFSLVALNILLVGSYLNLLVLLPQVAYVIYLFFQNKVSDALYWHLIFIMTSLNTTVNGAVLEDGNMTAYNYASFKIIGPVSLSYILTIFFAFIGLGNDIAKRYSNINIHIYKRTIRIFAYFGISGTFLGLIGLATDFYSFSSFISYNIYIWMTMIMMLVLLKNGSPQLILTIYKTALPIISASIVASLFTFLMGVSTSYGGIHGLPLMAELTYYSSLLIIGILYCRKPGLYILPIIFYFYLSSRNIIGKQIIIISIAIIILLYQVLFNKRYIKSHIKRLHLIRIGVICSVFVFLSAPILMNSNNLTFHKINQVSSLFAFEDGEVASSPATRIAETANFFVNNQDNPFALVFGKGYGGYITDELGLFVGHNLEGGGFSDDQLKSGRYSQLHDTFATVPLLNGLLGLGILFYVVRLHLKRFKLNYLVFAVVPWLIFTFYFSTQYAFTGVFFLYGSLVSVDYYHKSINN